nr:Chain C, gp41 MPER peptide [synthetic construct]
ALDKWD